ncbi:MULTISPECIES: EamA family transporter [Psychrobacter]|uniref:EamA family transporter n=1 Tax=Psychrobacter halodurans TaxID=2818439 RepID=A0AAW4IPE5_9GAMM|nr:MULTISPECIES: EamA family transporter [Psychrobacter]EGK15303.1 DMT superfamliy efflux pump [Psychrobacter sp. 1501(2011)]MBO1517179.1 EamA family transporter [Psychrobacter halodurans]MCD9151390.1 EamA family transporter [Psychrobacter sanguinis]MDN5734448.1 EamA family transporter [Psychrobacter sp.]
MTPIYTALAVLVTFIWGVNFTFIAWGLESFPPLMLTALRFFFTAVPLVFLLKPPKFNRTLFIYAIGTFVMQYAFVFTAMHLGASAGLTALLLQVQIFITVLLAYFILGEAVSRMQIIGMLVGVLGLSVIALNLGGDMPLAGFVCILIAAIGWSFGNIASKQVSTQATQQGSDGAIISSNTGKNKASALSALTLVVWGGLIACVILTLSSLIFETEAWQLATFTKASLKSWLSLGFIVYISTLIGFGLWAHLLSQNTASKVMPFALLVPVFGMTTSVLLTGEVVQWWKMLAMVLILSGLMLANMKMKQGRKRQPI